MLSAGSPVVSSTMASNERQVAVAYLISVRSGSGAAEAAGIMPAAVAVTTAASTIFTKRMTIST